MSRVEAHVLITLSIFNGEEFLREQIQSIKDLHTVNWLVLWRDDQSSDNSRELARELIDNDHRFIEIEGSGSHLGVLFSYQNLVKESLNYRWDWLAFCDQDDIWLSDRFEGIEQYGSSNVSSLIIGEVHLIDEYGFSRSRTIKPSQDVNKYRSVLENVGPGCSTAINPVLAGLFSDIEFEASSTFLHDHFCFAIASFSGTIIFDQKIWIEYRLHDNNTIGMNNNVKQVLMRLSPHKGRYVKKISQIAKALEKLPQLEDRDREFLCKSELLIISSFRQRLVYLWEWELRRQSITKELYTKAKILFNL